MSWPRYTWSSLEKNELETMKKHLICIFVCGLWGPLLSLHAAEDPGLKVGKKAPSFELQDQLGKKIRLEDMLKKGPVALVFHRSASW